MALKGNLRDFTITQLLNLINLARKTGALSITGSGETALVSFRESKLAYAQLGKLDSSLPAILHRAKILTASQFNTLKSRAQDMSDKELGLMLVNADYVTQEDIIASLQHHYINVIHQLFTWIDGEFLFENDILPPDGKIAVRIDLENIIIEGSRRLRELEQLQDELPNLDLALKFTDRPGVNMQNINLSVEEWRVVSFVNPKNSINQIAKATNMNDLEIRRIVYGLLQAGLVELIRPEGVSRPLPIRPSIPGASKKEQVNLVNRIIKRIRSL